jgi:hypothetical protein
MPSTQNDGKKQFKTPIYGRTTYWPFDRNKLPDQVDFCVTKGIPQDFAVTKSCIDLSSDHSLAWNVDKQFVPCPVGTR